jgi:uncharacterized protein YjbI with pentapeptide repeats
MKDLLLNRGLLTSKPNDEIRVIAITETLSAMRQLDGKRNSFLLQFLHDAKLIGIGSSNIVTFQGAELSLINLSGTNFCSALHSGTAIPITELYSLNLGSANLSGANLSGANLSSANLSGAHLSHTQSIGADLSCADLYYADLSGADLRYALQSHLWRETRP